MPNARPFRCLNVRVLVVSLIMGAALIVFGRLGKAQAPGSVARWSFAIAQAFTYAWFLLEMVKSVRNLDELEQRIHLEAFTGAAIFALIVVSAWGFLAKAGLPTLDWPVWIVPLITLAWVTRVFQIGRKYR
jgi:hypothetical protein